MTDLPTREQLRRLAEVAVSDAAESSASAAGDDSTTGGILGRVECSRDGSAVDDVVVAAFNFDPYRIVDTVDDSPLGGVWRQLAELDNLGLYGDVRSLLATRFLTSLLDQVSPDPVDELTALLGALRPPAKHLNAADVLFDPLWMLGDRIGSVVPAADGSFEISYAPERFRSQDVRRRADLLLAVFEPARAVGSKAADEHRRAHRRRAATPAFGVGIPPHPPPASHTRRSSERRAHRVLHPPGRRARTAGHTGTAQYVPRTRRIRRTRPSEGGCEISDRPNRNYPRPDCRWLALHDSTQGA